MAKNYFFKLAIGMYPNNSRIWPFSQFGMYSESSEFHAYYFRGIDGTIISNRTITSNLRMSVQNINARPLSPEKICDLAQSRSAPESEMRTQHAEIWLRTIQYGPISKKIIGLDSFNMKCF